MKIPSIGLGTWGMGGKYERDESTIESSLHALRSAIDIGYRLFDVAELYGEGLTEELVGQAIKRLPREEVMVVSKVWKTNLRYVDVGKAIEGSLRRLDTPYIDLYLIHWPNPEIPLKETMQALQYAYDQGLIRAIGVSNFDVPLLIEAQSYLSHTPISANQIEVSLTERSAFKDIIPYHRVHHGTVTMAHRPIMRGDISRIDNSMLLSMAEKYQKTPTQIALNWLISQDIIPIPKAGKESHLRENFEAADWRMQEEDIQALNNHAL